MDRTPQVRRGLFKLIVAAPIAAGVIWFAGSQNAATPAGYVGYVTRDAVFGHSRFLYTQPGPTSTGRSWLVRVTNVSVTPYTYSEDFTGNKSVLSHDNLKIGFSVHVVWRVNPQRVQQFVEQYSTLSPHDSSEKIVQTAYDNFIREPLRTFAREQVQKYDGLDAKDHIGQIGEAIKSDLIAMSKDSPFEISNVVVGNIQYPAEVENAVSEKLAATQVLERKKTEIAIAEADAARRVAEAKGIASSMEIINQKLTDSYLQHEAIEAQKNMVNSPNHTVIYVPVGPMGVPVTSMLNVEGSTKK